MTNIFEVGGKVRDDLMGIKSNDIDFTFVCKKSSTVDEGWDEMLSFLKKEKFKIFLETKDCFTVRAKFPIGHKHEGLVADFVMARKEVGYIKGTRKPILEIGTLFDDLQRRDFTINAIARDIDGNLIDPFNGLEDIKRKVLRTPQDPFTSFNDDPLRILRALRFSITKNFTITRGVWIAMKQDGILEKLEKTVSQERIRDEVTKMMKFDTIETMRSLVNVDREFIPGILKIVFKDNMWLKPTTEKK